MNRIASIIVGLACLLIAGLLHHKAATPVRKVCPISTKILLSHPSPPADEDLLTAAVPRLKLTDVTLADAIRQVSDLVKTPIDIAWDQLDAHHAAPDMLVTVDVKDVMLGEALRAIFDGIHPIRNPQAGFQAVAGRIRIGRPLSVPPVTKREIINAREILAKLDSGGPFDNDGGEYGVSLAEDFRSFLAYTVSTDSWRDQGGLSGQISPLGDTFVITQTRQNLMIIGRAIVATENATGSEDLVPVPVYGAPLELCRIRGLLRRLNEKKTGVSAAETLRTYLASHLDEAARAEYDKNGIHIFAGIAAIKGSPGERLAVQQTLGRLHEELERSAKQGK